MGVTDRGGMSIPAHVEAEVVRILNSAARRLLAEELHANTITETPSLADGGTRDDRRDNAAPLRRVQNVPVSDGDRASGREAA